ncbi:MAG: TetR family transcriptional regulator [Hyphomicrobiales bacterium]|nr:MAG: TetR family transcriptional regulator [Hyphomicrobiales bacterium]
MARTAGSRGAETAKIIRQKSLSLFARHGFAAVSMRMIADAVGVQPGALYQYHPTKQNILADLMQSHMETLLQAWENETQQGEPPQAALERFARFHIRFHITRPDEVFISYMELRSLENEGFKIIEAQRKRYEGELKAILEAGIAQKTFAIDDAHVGAMAILAMLTGVNTWYRSGGRLSQSKIEDIYAKMVLRSVGCAMEEDNV